MSLDTKLLELYEVWDRRLEYRWIEIDYKVYDNNSRTSVNANTLQLAIKGTKISHDYYR